jgi:hypothetical protein
MRYTAKRLGFGFLLVGWFGISTASAMTVRDYVKQRDSANIDGAKITRAYISGVAVGFIWANAARQSEKLPPLFCLPEKYSGGIDFAPMLDDEIGQEYVERDDAIELLILKGLRRTMPCPTRVTPSEQ